MDYCFEQKTGLSIDKEKTRAKIGFHPIFTRVLSKAIYIKIGGKIPTTHPHCNAVMQQFKENFISLVKLTYPLQKASHQNGITRDLDTSYTSLEQSAKDQVLPDHIQTALRVPEKASSKRIRTPPSSYSTNAFTNFGSLKAAW